MRPVPPLVDLRAGLRVGDRPDTGPAHHDVEGRPGRPLAPIREVRHRDVERPLADVQPPERGRDIGRGGSCDAGRS